MQKTCQNCSTQFPIHPEDLDFYDKISPTFNDKKFPVPTPTHCPACRTQRRHAWRNEYNLYARQCDLCEKQMITIYDSPTKFPVYCSTCWWSDKWDAQDHGIDYNPTKTFFQNYLDLQAKVPRMAIWNHSVENSEYTNHSSYLKNCYLTSTAIHSENVYYSRWVIDCRDVADCFQITNCELTYETFYTDGAYRNIHTYCSDSQECKFTYDCKGCTDLFMCHNLRQKKYCIENTQYSKEEYEKRMQQINLGSHEQFEKYKKQYLDMIKNKAIREHVRLSMCENTTGEMCYKCKNTHESFGCVESQDCRYCHEGVNMKDCYDLCEAADGCELQYETSGCDKGYQLLGCNRSDNCKNSYYLDGCMNLKDCFGCIGLNQKKNCILNKQYSPEEYQKLVAQIVEKMIKDGEWGEFFPVSASTYGYNETTAMEDFPLTKEEVESKGWNWKFINKGTPKPQTYKVPDDIKEVPDTITREMLACEKCGKNFKIIAAELNLYRKIGIPVPRKCPTCRREERYKIRAPIHKLIETKCSKCGKPTITSDNPDLPQQIYCEPCYLAAVY